MEADLERFGMSVKRFNIYNVLGDKGWEKRPSPKGEFVTSVAYDTQVKRLTETIKDLLIASNPDVQPAEAHRIYEEARKVVGLPTVGD